MRRNGVSSMIAAGLLIAGILIGMTGVYAATTYQTKIATQTVTTTAILTTTSTVSLPGVAEHSYDGISQNSSISAMVNEIFVIRLSSGAYDLGYVWNVSTSSGITYLSNTIVPSPKGCCGFPSLYYFFFRAVQAGNGTITLQMGRPGVVAATINIGVAVSPS
jgi:predicted secreted protein